MAVVAPEDATVEPVAARSRALRPRRRRRRSLTERITLNLVVGVVAALLAFVLAAALLADRREMTTVAVARDRIAVGTPLTSDLVTSQEVTTDTGFAETLLPFERVGDGALVATRTIQGGEPLMRSAVGDAGTAVPRRVMSIPLDAAQAANGTVGVGDQVDVIVTSREGEARYVLTAAQVVDRSGDGSSGGLVGGTSGSDLVISVEVDEVQALELASAIETGSITVVRSTGVAAADGGPGG